MTQLITSLLREVVETLSKYNLNQDGVIDDKEATKLVHEFLVGSGSMPEGSRQDLLCCSDSALNHAYRRLTRGRDCTATLPYSCWDSLQ